MAPADQTFTDSLFMNENDDRLNGGPVDQLGGTGKVLTQRLRIV